MLLKAFYLLFRPTWNLSGRIWSMVNVLFVAGSWDPFPPNWQVKPKEYLYVNVQVHTIAKGVNKTRTHVPIVNNWSNPITLVLSTRISRPIKNVFSTTRIGVSSFVPFSAFPYACFVGLWIWTWHGHITSREFWLHPALYLLLCQLCGQELLLKVCSVGNDCFHGKFIFGVNNTQYNELHFISILIPVNLVHWSICNSFSC